MVIKVSDDKELVAQIRAGLKAKGGYCPCHVGKDEDFKCMCKEFLFSNEPGPCHCGLYIKTEI